MHIIFNTFQFTVNTYLDLLHFIAVSSLPILCFHRHSSATIPKGDWRDVFASSFPYHPPPSFHAFRGADSCYSQLGNATIAAWSSWLVECNYAQATNFFLEAELVEVPSAEVGEKQL